MKLNDALQAASRARGLPVGARLFLVCGFEPLHLPTLLRAHYANREVGVGLDVLTGLYGDVEGNLARARASQASAAAVVSFRVSAPSRI